MKHVTYRGIRPTDPDGRLGLRNPERGWRIETLIAEPPGRPAWGPAAHLAGKVSSGYSDEWWLQDCARYEPHGLTLAQTYVYLNEYRDGPIPDDKLQWLQGAFDNLRAHGLKAVLRFAYERDMDRRNGATLERILAHIAQLKPIIQRNADVIFVMQAGFVGAWGEWHSSEHALESDHAALAKIVAAVLDALPADRMTQVRVPKYKRWVLDEAPFDGFAEVDAATAHTGVPTARIGFNNDGFLAGPQDGGTWPEAPLFGQPGNPEFDTMTRQSPYVAVDGELFWSDLGGKVDGLAAAVRLRLHHYSSFSLAHSFSEREGKPYSIDDWLQTPITLEQLAAEKMPISDGYFANAAGERVERTQFEYIRDHLGYRLELQTTQMPRLGKPGQPLPVTVTLINRGFSTLHNPRPVKLVLIGEDDRLWDLGATGADPRRWQPFDPADPEFRPLVHTIAASPRLPANLPPGRYRLGLWLPDAAATIAGDARYAVRVANGDVPWWTADSGSYGVNIVGWLDVACR